MKKELSKSEAKRFIEDYFSLNKLDKEKTRKIKRLAMKYNIKLSGYKKRFCRKCLADLKDGKIRIAKDYKTIQCKCGFSNRWKI